MRNLVACLLCAVLVGCTTMAAPQELKKKSTDELVYWYGYDQQIWGKKNENIRHELTSRSVFSDESWRLIDSKQVQQGCSPSVVTASWGPPSTKSETTYAGVKLATWIYDYPDNRATVYFENDRLKGWTR